MTSRTYREFTHREASFRICSDRFEAATRDIVRQRRILDEHIAAHPDFRTAMAPIPDVQGSPRIVQRMVAAAHRVGVGPMAAVAGAAAQCAAEAALADGAREAIVENGGDIYIAAQEEVVVGLYSGTAGVGDRLAFAVAAQDMPLAICSSSGRMGHSTSLGACDLATVVARDAALADAAATQAANLVSSEEDVDAALERIGSIEGVDGVVIVKGTRVGLVGRLPRLVRGKDRVRRPRSTLEGGRGTVGASF